MFLCFKLYYIHKKELSPLDCYQRAKHHPDTIDRVLTFYSRPSRIRNILVTIFGLVFAHKRCIQHKRFPDMSQIRNVMNPELKSEKFSFESFESENFRLCRRVRPTTTDSLHVVINYRGFLSKRFFVQKKSNMFLDSIDINKAVL